MEKIIMIGKIDINEGYLERTQFEKVFISIELKDKINTTPSKEGKKVLSISGVVGARKNGYCLGSCGQILNELKYITDFNEKEGWNKEKIEELYNIWNRYHLNDMNVGTQKQMEALREKEKTGWVYSYNEAVKYLKDINLYNDDGNIYGNAWYLEELPKGVINWFNNIKETRYICPWNSL